NRPLDARLAELNDLIPGEQASADILRINRVNSAQVLGEARDLHSRWETLERPEKRIVIETITRAITIGKEEVHIDLHYIPKTNPPGHSPGGSGGASRRPNTQANSISSDPCEIPLNKAPHALGLVRGLLGGTTMIWKLGSRSSIRIAARVSSSSASTTSLISSLSRG